MQVLYQRNLSFVQQAVAVLETGLYIDDACSCFAGLNFAKDPSMTLICNQQTAGLRLLKIHGFEQ